MRRRSSRRRREGVRPRRRLTPRSGEASSERGRAVGGDDGEGSISRCRAPPEASDVTPSRRTCFPRPKASRPARSRTSGWSTLGQGQRSDGDEESNLEAYVAEQRTLRNHLTEQLMLAFADPARRLIGHHLIDMTDEAGYLRGDLDALAELLGAPLELVEEDALRDAGLRAVRRVRPRPARMSDASAEGAGPLRPGDGGADRESAICLPPTISSR